MPGGHHGNAAIVREAAADARDGLGRLQKPLSRELPEADQHPRLDRADLRLQERLAARDLVRLGVAVLGGRHLITFAMKTSGRGS